MSENENLDPPSECWYSGILPKLPEEEEKEEKK